MITKMGAPRATAKERPTPPVQTTQARSPSGTKARPKTATAAMSDARRPFQSGLPTQAVYPATPRKPRGMTDWMTQAGIPPGSSALLMVISARTNS